MVRIAGQVSGHEGNGIDEESKNTRIGGVRWSYEWIPRQAGIVRGVVYSCFEKIWGYVI